MSNAKITVNAGISATITVPERTVPTIKASDKAIIYEEKIVKVEEKLYGEMELNLQGVVSGSIYGVAEIIKEEGI